MVRKNLSISVRSTGDIAILFTPRLLRNVCADSGSEYFLMG